MIAFPVTPFAPDLSLDLGGLRQNIRRLLRYPICGIVAAGGTGELYSLSPAEHAEVVRAVVEEAAGQVPVFAGAGFNCAIATELAKQSARLGAGAVLAFPPYFPNADEEALADYYATIGAATALPLFVYSRDWVNPSPAWVEKLALRVPTLLGWKDGQGDLRRYQQIIDRLGDRLHWIGGVGDDAVPGYYSIGIRVYTSSIANVAPKLSLELHEAAAGDSVALGRLMREFVIPLYALRSRRKGYEVSVMKEMMNLAGLPAGPVRPPLPHLRAEDAAALRAMMERWRPEIGS